jgi:hypothetical protein
MIIKNLAIMDAFKEWHHLLEGFQHEITMYSNYKKLIVFHDNSCFELMPNLAGIVLV